MTGASRTWRAPGRVNLIGGQVDWHAGWVVAMAIDREVTITRRPREDGRIMVRSSAFAEAVVVAADGRTEPASVAPAWGRFVAAAVRELTASGIPISGCDLDVASDLPVGAGLSSSAAFAVACLQALAGARSPSGNDLAFAAVRVEHAASGVPCGTQDPMAVVHGRTDHALLVDCRSHAVATLPWPEELTALVVHSGVSRNLADTPFAEYRAESLSVAAAIGVPTLRDATLEQVADYPRGRHAVSEIDRVRAFAEALTAGDHDALGPLMDASHASSRDDMGVSIPELDALTVILRNRGALGARLTGAGFGGCVVALVRSESVDAVAHAACTDYRAATGREPRWWAVQAGSGAGPVDAP